MTFTHPARWLAALSLAAGLSVAAPAHAHEAAAPPSSGTTLASGTVLRGLDLDRATVLDMQRAMDRGHFDSVTLTRFYLDRIRAVDPLLHAVIATNPAALQEARQSDLRRRRGAHGALEGIPVLLKDNIDTAGPLRTTAGSLALAGARPTRDAYLVQRLRGAGAVILGKANLSEWANFRSSPSSSGWSGVGGQTNNPYVLDRNPCGSSSGSAVAAAASLAAVTIGTETDGSIVCPASVNGVVGIKPTLGLVSRAGVVPLSLAQDTAGPITRNVTDAAAVLSVIQGVDPRDPATVPDGARDYLKALKPDALAGKRIGVWRSAAGDNQEAIAALDAAVATLRARGATVVDGLELPGMDQAGEAEYPALLTEFKHDVNAYLAATPGRHPDDLAGLIEFNKRHASTELRYFGQELFEQAQATTGDLTDPEYRAFRDKATSLSRKAIDSVVAENRLDAVLAPTNNAAWVTSLTKGDDFTGFVASSSPSAMSGYPAITVPGGYARSVLPLGVTFFGGRLSEPTLIALGYAFEQAAHVRKPPTYLRTLP
ncbi:amidase [Sphaerisporangium siamense]|uniref:Amidase n=1 Tax=Sphaerisporangium siamense TaxID=795645 RepID=A0A7W7G5P4_9ACTN|nr:amidase [Sphaerisporangium siamense]MBB4698708.1 amidase [Sphaerisporangium siamense]GII85233.1 amidase [Sphaerisporangium siamense]